MLDVKEVCVEMVQGESFCLATVCVQKYINETYRLQKKHPDLVDIQAVNDDGSLLVKFPAEWFSFVRVPRKGRVFTEEEKIANGDRLREYHKKKKEEKEDEGNEENIFEDC